MAYLYLFSVLCTHLKKKNVSRRTVQLQHYAAGYVLVPGWRHVRVISGSEPSFDKQFLAFLDDDGTIGFIYALSGKIIHGFVFRTRL